MFSELTKRKKYELSRDSWLLQDQIQGIEIDWKGLWALKPNHKTYVRMPQGLVATPRVQQSYLRDYAFSCIVAEAPKDLPPILEPWLKWANHILHTCEDIEPQFRNKTLLEESEGCFRKLDFNQILINWYKDGLDYISAHSDSEKQLVPQAPILSVSLGATRTFRIRAKDMSYKYDIVMPDRTYVIMGGRMQQECTHEVPKISGQKGKVVGPRINITFRIFA
jgi:hypothetical protein